ncbi:MAG: DUF3445 domain-containing protein [Planctomycetaceae bacterium]|nr:DUF3445 domain-containing protein [Planctomycetaceae bacterium]
MRLFSEGDFRWELNLRRGDAEAFFAPAAVSKELLTEKQRWLDESSKLYLAETSRAQPLVSELWDLALSWRHVSVPDARSRDLRELARRWEPDLLLMDRETLSVAAGCVCFPSSWDLRRAIGRRVSDVHEIVPRLNHQVGPQIERFLTQLQPGKAFCRENWSLTRTSDRNYHPALQRCRLDDAVTIQELHLRVEQQVFTALHSGLLMGIRIAICPLKDLAAIPQVWRNFRDKLRTMPDDVAIYKSMHAARGRIIHEMDRFESSLDG